MIEKENYIKLISSSNNNPASPIELVTNIDEIEDFIAQTNQMIGVFDNSPFYKFRMDVYKNKNTGKKFRYCNVEYDKSGAASLVVVHILKGDSKGDYVLLQRNYRVFINQFIFEIPRGFADFNDKNSLDTMMRELFEETSINLENIEHSVSKLGGVYPDSGLTNNFVDLYRVDIFVNSDITFKNNDSNEFIDKYKLLPVSEIPNFISKITDGFTLCTLAKAFINV